jgi:hypothetical protein
MKRMTSMARAALLAGLLLCVGTAAADDRAQFVDAIMGKATFDCSTEAFQLAVQGADSKTASLMLYDVRRELHLTDKWNAGNPDYDKAYAMLLAAAANEARRSGPLITETSAAALMRAILSSMPTTTLRRFSEFFTAPRERLSVPYLIDIYACTQIQEWIGDSGDDYADGERQMRRMLAASSAQSLDWQNNVEPLTQEEKVATGAVMGKLLDALVTGLDAKLNSPARAARSAAIRRAHQGELNHMAQPYVAAP